jgi:phospholipid/cholesterol/gamma-HCH transport system permease protein
MLGSIGRQTLKLLDTGRGIAALGGRTLRTGWEERGPHGTVLAGNLARQIRFTGLQALWLVALAAWALGTITILQTELLLRGLAEPGMVERMMVFVLVRELPAMIVALVLIARSGTAVATELANMHLNQELEALDAHGVPPHAFVVLPRLLAFPIAALCLTFYFIFIALAGGLATIPVFYAQPLQLSLDALLREIRSIDLILPMAKSVLFGGLIALCCSFHGLSVRRSFREVPQATTRGVTASFGLCMVANALLSLAAFL